MPLWIVHTGLCLFSFGLWGFFSKLALDIMPAKTTLVFQAFGIMLVTLCLIKPMLDEPQFTLTGGLFAVLTGVASTVGTILFFLAIKSQGKISIIITMTALYPLITILLAWIFLHEPITLKQGCGMGLAVIAMMLLAT